MLVLGILGCLRMVFGTWLVRGCLLQYPGSLCELLYLQVMGEVAFRSLNLAFFGHRCAHVCGLLDTPTDPFLENANKIMH